MPVRVQRRHRDYWRISGAARSAIVTPSFFDTDWLMDSRWITPVLCVLFFTGAMAVFKRWMARQRLRSPAEANQLANPPAILIVGLIGTVFFGVIFIASLLWPDGTENFLVHALFLGLFLLSIYLVAEYFLVHHHVDSQGMDCARLLGPRRRFAWADVERVDFNQSMNWYRLKLASGDTVRVSGAMMGLPIFARHVLDHVPQQRLDLQVRPMLDRAAIGELHPL